MAVALFVQSAAARALDWCCRHAAASWTNASWLGLARTSRTCCGSPLSQRTLGRRPGLPAAGGQHSDQDRPLLPTDRRWQSAKGGHRHQSWRFSFDEMPCQRRLPRSPDEILSLCWRTWHKENSQIHNIEYKLQITTSQSYLIIDSAPFT
jgi:hypothetical protein